MASTIEEVTSALWKEAQPWKLRGSTQRFRDRISPHGTFGGYFEHLVARILGGRVLFDPKNQSDHKPDIYDSQTGTWRESKSIHTGHHPNLVIGQTRAYGALATREPVEYVFIRHRVRETGVQRPARDIFAKAAASPKIGLALPWSIVGAAIDVGWPYSNVYPRYGKGCYTLASSLLGGLIETPEAWIRSIGLDGDAYSYEVFRTPAFTNLGHRVQPFIFRYIREKN